MNAPDLYVVVHESPMGTRDDGTERVEYGVAGSLHDRPPVNHLAYCRALAERKGDVGRYFIACVVEIPDPDLAVGP